MNIPKQTALVTGASAGIGREIVRVLVRERGMTVVATARRLERLETLRDELPEGTLIPIAGDLGDARFRDRLWAETLQKVGHVDVLVNNAGIGLRGPLADQAMEDVERLLNLNVVALIDLTQKAVRVMSERKQGQIVQISSIVGAFGVPYSAVYVASKHAVDGLVKSLRPELRGTGVRIWAARPGRTASEFYNLALGGQVASKDIPPARSAETVARAIVRGLDHRQAFLAPTLDAGLLVGLCRWAPGFEYVMGRVAKRVFDRELANRNGGGDHPISPAAPGRDEDGRSVP